MPFIKVETVLFGSAITPIETGAILTWGPPDDRAATVSPTSPMGLRVAGRPLASLLLKVPIPQPGTGSPTTFLTVIGSPEDLEAGIELAERTNRIITIEPGLAQRTSRPGSDDIEVW